MSARKIIIDTDPGQDDAFAILLALGSPELDMVAVTAVAGNGRSARPSGTRVRSWNLPDARTSASRRVVRARW
jgi:inosine-uridine nucleoside N-ribohydrolase